MNHSWNHDPFQGGGPVPHRPKKQRKPIGTPLGRTREYLSSMAQLGYSRQQVKALLDTWEEE